MKKRIIDFFSKNLGLKTVSLVIAFVIWLTVLNISNPEIVDHITTTVSVKNTRGINTEDTVYTLGSDTVRIDYTVRTNSRNRVTASCFDAYVDLSDYSVTGALPVYVNIDPGIETLISDVSVKPLVLHVNTEKIQEKRFDVGIKTSGSCADGYISGPGSVFPSYVYVRGPISEIGTISSVGINVDLSGSSGDIKGKASIEYYDANGNTPELSDLVKCSTDVEYSFPVYRIKSLPVTASTIGVPASGCYVDGIIVEPEKASIYGSEEYLEKISIISVPGTAVNIDNASENVVSTFDLRDFLPEGTGLLSNSPEVTVVVKIQKQPETVSASRPGSSYYPGDDEPGQTETESRAESKSDIIYHYYNFRTSEAEETSVYDERTSAWNDVSEEELSAADEGYGTDDDSLVESETAQIEGSEEDAGDVGEEQPESVS